MVRLVAKLGINRGNTGVIYDGGSLFATRPWWVLRYLGHGDVRILNGGLAAWGAAGGTAATGSAAVATPIADTPPAAGTFRSDLLAPLAEVQATLGDPGIVIVDARTPKEYAEGHIPGAVNLNYLHNAAPEPPKVWNPAAELRAMYEALGVTPDKRVIPYCASGVRSSVTDFTLRLLGYEDVALFTGSWNEWTRHPESPITTGPNP
jgi:thiosulfate/3-mercaptopyruvate sulfurtransferase